MKKYRYLTKEIKKVIAYYSRYDDLLSVAKYINNKIEKWFTRK